MTSLSSFSQRIELQFPLPEHPSLPHPLLRSLPEENIFPDRFQISIPIRELSDLDCLLLHLFYLDSPNLDINIFWFSTDSNDYKLLASGFAGKTSGLTSYRLLLDHIPIGKPGTLLIHALSPQRTIHKILLTPLIPVFAFAEPNPAQPPHVEDFFLLDRKAFRQSELRDKPHLPVPDAWHRNFVRATLHQEPISLDQPIAFAFDVRPAPRRGVLHFQLKSPSLSPFSLWLNGYKLPSPNIETPSFSRPEWFFSPNGAEPIFAGWRDASLPIPPGVIQPGENTITFSTNSNDTSIQNVFLELLYDSEIPTPSATEPSPAHPLSDLALDIQQATTQPLSSLLPPTPSPLTSPRQNLPSSTTPLEPSLEPMQIFRTTLLLE